MPVTKNTIRRRSLTNENPSDSGEYPPNENPIPAIPVRSVKPAKGKSKAKPKPPKSKATKPKASDIPIKQRRYTRNSQTLKTKPMTESEGSAIGVSSEGSTNSKESTEDEVSDLGAKKKGEISKRSTELGKKKMEEASSERGIIRTALDTLAMAAEKSSTPKSLGVDFGSTPITVTSRGGTTTIPANLYSQLPKATIPSPSPPTYITKTTTTPIIPKQNVGSSSSQPPKTTQTQPPKTTMNQPIHPTFNQPIVAQTPAPSAPISDTIARIFRQQALTQMQPRPLYQTYNHPVQTSHGTYHVPFRFQTPTPIPTPNQNPFANYTIAQLEAIIRARQTSTQTPQPPPSIIIPPGFGHMANQPTPSQTQVPNPPLIMAGSEVVVVARETAKRVETVEAPPIPEIEEVDDTLEAPSFKDMVDKGKQPEVQLEHEFVVPNSPNTEDEQDRREVGDIRIEEIHEEQQEEPPVVKEVSKKRKLVTQAEKDEREKKKKKAEEVEKKKRERQAREEERERLEKKAEEAAKKKAEAEARLKAAKAKEVEMARKEKAKAKEAGPLKKRRLILQDSEEEEEYNHPPNPPPQRITRQRTKNTVEGSPTAALQQSSGSAIAPPQKQKKKKVISAYTTPVELLSGPLAVSKYPSFASKVAHTPKVFANTMVNAYPQLKTVVEAMEWETLLSYIGEYNIEWVREFFTELSVTTGTELVVRQTPVSYSPESINSLLGLTPPEDSEYDRLQTQATEEDYEMILERLSLEGTKWEIKYRQRILKCNRLKGEVNVWFYFMRHTLFPTSHDTYLDIDRIFYLYCMVEGYQFDVGALMSKAMKSSIEKGNKQLPYPSIIQKLLERAKVPSLATDTIVRDKVQVDKQSLLRLLRFPEAIEAGMDVGGQPSNAGLESLKAELLEAMEKQTESIKEMVHAKHKKLKEKLMAIEKDVEVIKKDRAHEALHKKHKEQIKEAYRLGQAQQPLKMPPKPKSVFLEDSPTLSE